MVDYGKAIKRPFTDIKKLIIGFVLNIIPIVNFLVIGYQLECAKTAMKKNFKLPEWENWGDLFIIGLLGFIIVVIYFIPFLIVLAILGISLLPFIAFGGRQPGISEFSNFIGGGIILTIVFVIAMYLLPVALLSYVERLNFGDAFSFGKVFKKAFTSQYFISWFLLVIYGFIISVILSVIPFVGGALSGYIIGVTAMTVFGELYHSL